MRKFGRATVVGGASLAGLLAMAALASASNGSAAMAAPAVTKARPLAKVKPGGPMALPGNRPSSPLAFSGKTVNIVSQNWGGYVAQRQGVKFRYVRATFFVPYVEGLRLLLDGLRLTTCGQRGAARQTRMEIRRRTGANWRGG